MKVSGQTDWFWWVFIAGLPFGIHKMRLILIPRGMDTTTTLGMAALCHYWSIDWKHHDSSVCDQSDIRVYTVCHWKIEY